MRLDVIIAVLPLFHLYGMQVVLNCGLRVGATIVTMPRFDLQNFLRFHEEYGVTRSFVAPPIVLQLAKEPSVTGFDLSRLQQVFSVAAASFSKNAMMASERLGCEVVQGYGMTELSPATNLSPPGGGKEGAVGPLVPNTEMLIVDTFTGKPVNVDRVRELIKVKGFQVAPVELEALLLTHPLIGDAAVIGVPSGENGEVPVAFVVSTGPLSEDEVKVFIAEQVATYKQLADVRFVASIPKSPAGKILRRELRANACLSRN